ncbi:hypothetical protein KY360_06545 [Candidatus Woesearchaeota archaeon]|nr:hypothetical protein [Candidatus Woesearchaeota archaeon]
MAVIGFNFNKIDVEKKDVGKGKVNISNNVAIKNIEQKGISLGKSKQDALRFTFEFTSKYEPKLGSILLGGDVLFLTDASKSKEILDGWKKDKKVPKDIMAGILNTVLAKCNIQALILSQEVNLPPPIPLPKVKVGGKEKEYIG